MNFIQTAQEILSIKQNYSYHLDHLKLKEQNIEKVYDDDFNVHIFEQVWGNTTGGFGGIGGSAMTTQTTYVLVPKFNHDCLVFFGGKFAYRAPYSRKFIDDVVKENVRGKGESSYYK